MDLILFAVPFFFLLIGLELLADRWRGVRSYRLADSLNSLSAGVLSTSLGLVTKGLALLTYDFAWRHLGLFALPSDSSWVWLGAFVFYDLCYYWHHRLGHERNVLWAAHSVHHQSEEYNLSTALRQTSTGFLFGWLFYLPMAVAGVPPQVFLTVAALNLLYQFWVHTRHVPTLGWVEWVMVTPSNHRAHHAQNAIYMDRNYGGVFIVWDRWFDTFQAELDEHPVVFGITTPLASWNPLWANLQGYAVLWRDAVGTASWWDKGRIWFMRTGWRPADRVAAVPQVKADLSQFVKFAVPLAPARQVYALIQFGFYVLGGSYLLAHGDSLSGGALLLSCGWMMGSLYSLGAWLESRAWAMRLECLRLLLNVPALLLAQMLGLLPAGGAAGWSLLLYSLCSAVALGWLRRRAVV